MNIIDGKKVSNEIKEELKTKIEDNNITPGLAIIMASIDPASEIYVNNKVKAASKIGIDTFVYSYDEDNTNEDIIKQIKELNNDPNINGIIVQSPVYDTLDESYITSFIDPKKDVDGFGIYSLGKLASNEEGFIAATPLGILKLLEYYNIDIEGCHVVIMGRSKIVGRPLAILMLNKNATVTITHSKTKNIKSVTKEADILITAIGKPKYVDHTFIKEGVVVIDVGMNEVDGHFVGDVDFEDVKDHTSYITPVPGGVGPMTVAMLLSNTVDSCLKEVK